MEPVMVEKIQSVGLEPVTASPAFKLLSYQGSTLHCNYTVMGGALEAHYYKLNAGLQI